MGRARVAPLASEGGDGARPQVVPGGGRTQGRVGEVRGWVVGGFRLLT